MSCVTAAEAFHNSCFHSVLPTLSLHSFNANCLMPSLTTCQRPTNKIFKRVSQTVCVSAWVWCFAMIPIPFFLHFLSSSCFNGALRHWHSGTLCWEGHRKHHGQVTHGWKGHSPRGVTHDGTMAGIIHLEHDGINAGKAVTGWWEVTLRKAWSIDL